MALVKCSDCGKMVSSHAEKCPNCGCPAEYFETVEKREENLEKLPVGVKEYNIAGRKLRTTQEEENTAYFSQMYQEIATNCCKQFETKFYGLRTVEDIINNVNDIAENYFQYAFDETIRYFQKHGIYNIDKNIFLQKYYTGATSWDDAYEYIYEQYANIVGKQDEIKAYRELRKANRGKVAAFGFTFKGYVKGAVQAGTINLATGLAHSLFNSIGNSITNAVSEKKMKELHDDPSTWQLLLNGLYNSIIHLKYDIMNALNKESNIKCKVITSDDINRSIALVKSAKNQALEKKTDILIQALQVNLFNADAYIELVKCAPNEILQIEELSKHFGVDLTHEKKQNVLNKLFEINAVVSKMDVVQNEPYSNLLKLHSLYEEWTNLISLTGWTREEINKNIDGFETIDKKVCLKLRSVDEVVFDTKEIALEVAKEVEQFYLSMKGKDLNDPIVVQQITSEMGNYNKINTYYPEFLKNKLDRKIQLNNPDNLPPELAKICWKPEIPKSIQEKFVLKGLSKDFLKKKENIQKAISLIGELNVIALVMISGKKGFVITDKKIFHYEFSALSFKNKIDKLEEWNIEDFESVKSERQSLKIIKTNPQTMKKEFSYMHCPVDESEVELIANVLDFCVLFLKSK